MKENYSDIIADQIQTIKEMKEEIENLNHQVKYLEDQQDQVTDKQGMNKIPSDYAKKYYTIIGDVSGEPDNASRENTEFSRSLSSDGGYGSDEENCDNDLSYNISPISSIEKVVENGNVGSSLSPCIMCR